MFIVKIWNDFILWSLLMFEYRFPIWSMLDEQTEAFIKIHSSFSVDLDFFGLSGISENVICGNPN